MKNVLVVASHADDEVLGCGGTMAKHIENGDKVTCFVLCMEREKEYESAAKIIGFDCSVSNLDDQKFDTIPILDITKAIERTIADVKPNIVYTHWIGDLNKDHEITARATLTACRPLPGSKIEAIYGFEIPSSTEWGFSPFVPTHYEDISPHFMKKIDALVCYDGEIKPRPHARSYAAVTAQSAKRGAECGVENAEAFHTYRTIRRI